jgi:hypothetical protein
LRLPRGRQAELESFVSQLAGTDLDRRRPIWQFHFIDDFQGGSAAVLRIHHCYADGIAMVRVFLTLTDEVAKPAARRRAPHPGAGPADAGAETQNWFDRLNLPGADLLSFPCGRRGVARARWICRRIPNR